MKHRFIYFLLFFSFMAHSQTGRLYHKTFTKQDGLELDVINAMAFDDEGFMWLGGTNFDIRTIILNNKKLSLQRFNGKTFHSIPLPETDETFTQIEQIYKRSDGKFYLLGSAGGHILYLFDPHTLQYTEILAERTNSAVTSISHVFKDKDRDLLLIQDDREIALHVLHPDLRLEKLFGFTSSENKFRMDASTRVLAYEDFCVIGDDNFPITFLDWKGTILNRLAEDSFRRDRPENENKLVIDEFFNLDGVDYMFMRNNANLHFLDSSNFTVIPERQRPATLPSENLRVFTDPLGNHLVASANGEQLTFSRFYANEGLKQLFSAPMFDDSPKLEILSKDLTKELWLGTSEGELHYFRFPSEKIKTFLPNKSIRAIAPLDSLSYVIATEEAGWYKMRFQEMTVAPFELTQNGIPFDPYSTRNIFVANDTIWSNSGGYIIEVALSSGIAKTHRHYPVICLLEATDSTLLYGTRGYHLMEFNKRTKTHTPLITTDTLFNYDIELRDNLVVGGTDKGVFTYDLDSGNTKFFGASDTFPDPFVLMTDYHKDYGYLLGTRSGDLVAFDPKKETFTTIYEDDLNAGIATILFDGDTWWINTFNGVVAFDPVTKTSQRFSEKDGLSHNEANRYSALDTGDGFLVGTISGLNYFKPEELKLETTNSELVLLGVRNYDPKTNSIRDILDRKSLSEGTEITLPAEQKELQVDFSLTNAIDDTDNSFRYRIDRQDWIDLREERSIRFPNLAAGTYALEIEALDFSGNKLGESLLINVNSKDFFYNTPWFYLLVFLAVAGLLLYFLKVALAKRKMQEKFSGDLLLSQETERTRIAKELHDSVGQQLTLIKKKAQNEGQDEIINLTQNALEEVRSISRGLYPAVLKQLGLTESIEQLIYELDESTDIFFSSHIDEINTYFSEEEGLNYYRFIQESFSNILKHADATSVSLRIEKEKDNLVTEISDNGKGFDASEKIKKNSLGLKTILERIRLLKGTIQINSKRGVGTTIRAEIPIR